ncbi:MAG: D-2-hydroxyacid dehydrogenase [Oscillospiraceae bacterium]|nr:D-2-hydroxyacid dehydrogenase [Oscillospiraceae bacterium]
MKILMPEANTLTKGDIDLSAFEEFGDVVTLTNPTREELKKEIADADAIFINKTVLNEELLGCAKNLKYIGECATGFNNIDIAYCKEHGITVTNVPDYSTNAVAQQVFAYILAHYSKVNEYNEFVANDGWVKSDTFAPFVFDTDELFGKTLGLVGYGKIGKAVAKIANAFGMNVLVYTRSYGRALEMSKGSRGETDKTVLEGFLNRTESYVTYVSLDNLLKHSDIVSVHCPLNEESENLFCTETFNKMRRGAFFINTARGPVVNENDLKEALDSGRLSGAAVDVVKVEPMEKDCPLKGHPKCIVTPHVAWAPESTRKRLVAVVLKNFEKYLKGTPQNIVD